MSLEIICSACGADAFVRKEPVYDGFRKAGEKIFCASCGYDYTGQAVPYKVKESAPKVFAEDDKPRKLNIFDEGERLRNCRHCEHYVVNPFVQRCSLHDRAVEATDVCFDFMMKKKKDSSL